MKNKEAIGCLLLFVLSLVIQPLLVLLKVVNILSIHWIIVFIPTILYVVLLLALIVLILVSRKKE
jgi:hypothetical protein